MPFEVPYRFRDRSDAGEQLARRLEGWRGRADLLVLALPRGGVPVAYPVARRLAAPLDVFVVRKLGWPGREELAFGALASGGRVVLNHPLADQLSREQVEAAVARAREELAQQERSFRGVRDGLQVQQRAVIVVDDGLATGATMRAALTALRALGAHPLVCAVPVAPAETCEEMSELADEVVCLLTPSDFLAVGNWYQSFGPVSDAQVHALLEQRLREESGGAGFPEEAPYP